MINSRLEYEKMYAVEQKLWWYKILHGKVLNRIVTETKKPNSEISLLDAACGTGGLLTFLRTKGFENISGFDYSQHDIEFSRERGLDVEFGDLRNVDSFRPGWKYDVICCSDALYFLTDDEIVQALEAFKRRLNPNGIIIINIHAFEAFAGMHDIAIGSSRRFEFEDFKKYSSTAGLKINQHTYWPFALSLPILAVRKWQKFQLSKATPDLSHTDSDVNYPGDFVNSILLGVTRLEENLFRSAPFGSSLFMVLS